MEKILRDFAANRNLLDRLPEQGMSYVRERLNWDGKALMVSDVLVGWQDKGPKPDLPSPEQSGTTKLSLQRETVFATAAARCLPNLAQAE
jgi:hypothetical protein